MHSPDNYNLFARMTTLPKELHRRLRSAFSIIESALFAETKRFCDIEVKGRRKFCEKVIHSLDLLKDKDPANLDLINANFPLIIQSTTTFLSLGLGGAALTLEGEETLKSSDTWLAGLLAYHAYRAQLYSDYKNQHMESHEVPENAYSGDKVSNFHYECLRRIGASYEELEHLSKFIAKQRS